MPAFSEGGKIPYVHTPQPGASTGALTERYMHHRHGNDLAFDIRAQGSAVGDGSTDDTDAILEVLDDAPEGATILIPPNRTFIVSPTSEDVIFPLTKKLHWVGGGNSKIKVASGSGNFSNIIAGDTPERDLSGCRFMGVTFDLNLAGNAVTAESQLQGTVGEYTRRRNPIHIETGEDIQVLYCTFIDAPRQGVWLANASDLDAIVDPVVAYNRFVTTVEATGDWDNTAVFVIGDNAQIVGNRIRGLPSNYYISRTSIQLSGGGVVSGNIIDRYYRGPVVGNPNYDGPARDITVTGNVVRNCNYGLVIHSTPGATYTEGPGIENLQIVGNVFRTNKTDYERDSTDGSSPCGIFLHSSGDRLPIRNVNIAHNEIDNVSTYTTDGFSGINLVDGGSVPGSHSNITVENNTIANAGRNGIHVNLTSANVVAIRDNTVRNPGHRSDTSGNQTAGVRIGGAVDVLTVAGNDCVDTRGTHEMEMGVYVDSAATITYGRITPGQAVCTDGVRIPYSSINAAGVEIPRAFTFSALSVTDSTTLVDALRCHLLPDTDYTIDATLSCDGPAAGDLKLGFTTPSGVSGFWSVFGPNAGSSSSSNTSVTMASTTWTGTATIGMIAAGTQVGVRITGQIRTNAGGDLVLQFAQNTADASPTRIVNGELRAIPQETWA
jgi:hypothetical protein